MMRSWCLAAGFGILLLLLTSLPAHASDDSNSRNLAREQGVNLQATASALNSLTQNLNDTSLSQAVSQFDSQVKAGDYNGAASTLVQLRADAQNDPNSSAALNALVQSLSVGPNGISLDSNLLSSLLGLNSASAGGVPGGLANESPQQASLDLSTLANLTQGVNPTLAADLFSASLSALGAGGVNVPGFHLGGIQPPVVSLPSIGGGGPAAISSSPGEVVLPILLVGGILVVFLSKNRLAGGLGAQALPGSRGLEDDGSYSGLNTQDPRQRIIMQFGRMVRIMRGKGVSKLRGETHREFSSRLGGSQDAPQVRVVSSLYEKARFSSLEIAPAEADEAQREVDTLEMPT